MRPIYPEDIGHRFPDPDELLADKAAGGGTEWCGHCGRSDVPLTEVGDELYCVNCERNLED